MPTYGRQVLGKTGRPLEVTADGKPEWKTGGVTLDWSTVTAVGADTTLADDTLVKSGAKALEFGTVLCRIIASGKFGPYASGAADGRQTLTRGSVFILNETLLELGTVPGLMAPPTDHPGVIEGGRLRQPRVKVGSAGQPTVAALEAAMPRVSWVID